MYGLMGLLTKVSGLTIKSMVTVFTCGQMAASTMARGLITICRATAFTFTRMGSGMMAST